VGYLYRILLRRVTFCAEFTITAAVTGRDGSNLPFSIKSSISFDDLRILIAEKLHCFPGLLKLCYTLDKDKAKAPPTLIGAADELKFFVSRMRQLIVPPRLANGKISTRQLKPITVFFKDASTDNVANNAGAGTGTGKKVGMIFGVSHSPHRFVAEQQIINLSVDNSNGH
jgi:hypothetical protein